jgi:hypothetical protein
VLQNGLGGSFVCCGNSAKRETEKQSKGRRGMKRFFLVVAAALAALAFGSTLAFAQSGTPIQWQGHGSENLPCSGNEHWVLSPAKGITSATLYIDGVPYAMSQNGAGSYSADTDVGFDGSQSVSVTYFGDNDSAFLKLSHCDSGQSTTGGTTTGGTDGGTTDGGTTDGGTTDGGTTDGGTTDGGTTDGGTTGGGTTGGGTTGGGTTGGGTGGGDVIGSTTGGSGNTGGELPFTGLPIWIPMLLSAALLASGGFLVRRKRGEAG